MKGIKPDDPPQDMNKSHLSDSTSTTITLMNHVMRTPHVTIYFIWILSAFHLDYKTTHLFEVLDLDQFLILKAYFR